MEVEQEEGVRRGGRCGCLSGGRVGWDGGGRGDGGRGGYRCGVKVEDVRVE